MSTTIDPTIKKLPIEWLDRITLGKGSHEARGRGVCALEAVAWLAGEPHTDVPTCVDATIAQFVRTWNDDLPAADRIRLLRPILPRLIGTAAGSALEEKRAYLALDWLVRIYAPEWLALHEDLRDHAAELRGLPVIVDLRTAEVASPRVRAAGAAAWPAAWPAAWDAAGAAARDAARAAAWDAAWDAAGAAARAAAWPAAWDAAGAAAWDAARDAARAAAWPAAWDAAGAAAWDAAWDAAGAAAWDAARDAAGAAARDALAPTTLLLQASAIDLLERMIEAK